MFLSQDTTTRQIDRVQRRIFEPYEHHCLKDNVEKKRITLLRMTLVFVVSVVVSLMSAYFCPHLMFNSGYLIEFVCLKIDLIDNSDN